MIERSRRIFIAPLFHPGQVAVATRGAYSTSHWAERKRARIKLTRQKRFCPLCSTTVLLYCSTCGEFFCFVFVGSNVVTTCCKVRARLFASPPLQNICSCVYCSTVKNCRGLAFFVEPRLYVGRRTCKCVCTAVVGIVAKAEEKDGRSIIVAKHFRSSRCYRTVRRPRSLVRTVEAPRCLEPSRPTFELQSNRQK